MHPLKKSVIIQIPYYQIETEHNEINVKGKWSDENEWVDVGFLKKVIKSQISVIRRALPLQNEFKMKSFVDCKSVYY